MTIDEKIEVLQAFKEGKEIEYLPKPEFGEIMPLWVNKFTPQEDEFDFSKYNYRIKQEPKFRPYVKVRPFTKVNPEWVGKAVKLKGREKYSIINGIESDNPHPIDIAIESGFISLSKFFKYYEWLDGAPCGELDD